MIDFLAYIKAHGFECWASTSKHGHIALVVPWVQGANKGFDVEIIAPNYRAIKTALGY